MDNIDDEHFRSSSISLGNDKSSFVDIRISAAVNLRHSLPTREDLNISNSLKINSDDKKDTTITDNEKDKLGVIERRVEDQEMQEIQEIKEMQEKQEIQDAVVIPSQVTEIIEYNIEVKFDTNKDDRKIVDGGNVLNYLDLGNKKIDFDTFLSKKMSVHQELKEEGHDLSSNIEDKQAISSKENEIAKEVQKHLLESVVVNQSNLLCALNQDAIPRDGCMVRVDIKYEEIALVIKDGKNLINFRTYYRKQ